jgi:hypothetical protein
VRPDLQDEPHRSRGSLSPGLVVENRPKINRYNLPKGLRPVRFPVFLGTPEPAKLQQLSIGSLLAAEAAWLPLLPAETAAPDTWFWANRRSSILGCGGPRPATKLRPPSQAAPEDLRFPAGKKPCAGCTDLLRFMRLLVLED